VTVSDRSGNLRFLYDGGLYVVVAFQLEYKSSPFYRIFTGTGAFSLIVRWTQTACCDDDEISAAAMDIGTNWKVKFQVWITKLFDVRRLLPNVEDISEVNESRLCQKLQAPAGSGSTARRRSCVVLPCTDLSKYNIHQQDGLTANNCLSKLIYK